MTDISTSKKAEAKARQTFDGLKMLEKQIQMFFIIGQPSLSEAQRQKALEYIDQLLNELVHDASEIEKFKKMIALTMLLKPDNLSELYKILDDMLDINS